MNNTTTAFIFSPCRGDESDNARIAHGLAELGRAPNALGCYQGTLEKSYVLIGAEARERVERLCEAWEQECYLEVAPGGASFLVYPDGRELYIGKLVNVGRKRPTGDWTRLGGYYYQVQGGAHVG